MADDESTDEGEDGARGSRKLLFVAIGSVILLAGAGAATFFVMTGTPTEEAAEAPEPTGDAADEVKLDKDGNPIPTGPVTHSFEPMIVNIFDGEKDRFLKITIDVEVSEEAVSAEITERLPQVKDLMITLISAQAYSDIRSIDGKVALREQLQTRLNSLLKTGLVRQVFFTEFIVQ